MQASRASSRAFKAIAAGSMQTRNLSMTGSTTFSSLLTSERPALNLPRDIAGLRSECSKRKLPTTGSQDELVSRLSAHELTNTRSFSTAMRNSKRPIPSPNETSTSIRLFNTSRSLKSVGDSSTIDFAFFPDFDPDTKTAPAGIRVPILPQTTRLYAAAEEVQEEVMIPMVYTVNPDVANVDARAALSDLVDNVDFKGMASYAANKLSKDAEEGVGMVRQIWTGLVDDVVGGSKGPVRA